MANMTVSETLRQAIKQSAESQYAISKGCGVEQSALSRFLSGERGLADKSIDAIAAYLGLELRPVKRPGKRA
jgi:transcriptional regulator with XRE-family HTH domain